MEYFLVCIKSRSEATVDRGAYKKMNDWSIYQYLVEQKHECTYGQISFTGILLEMQVFYICAFKNKNFIILSLREQWTGPQEPLHHSRSGFAHVYLYDLHWLCFSRCTYLLLNDPQVYCWAQKDWWMLISSRYPNVVVKLNLLVPPSGVSLFIWTECSSGFY